jgi:hypothetical protein
MNLRPYLYYTGCFLACQQKTGEFEEILLKACLRFFASVKIYRTFPFNKRKINGMLIAGPLAL